MNISHIELTQLAKFLQRSIAHGSTIIRQKQKYNQRKSTRKILATVSWTFMLLFSKINFTET